MAQNLVVWEGLAEYRAQLAAMPEACAGEAAKVIEGETNALAVALRSAYPVFTGNLRDHVEVIHTPRGGRLKANSTVRNTARHALLFERGTETRWFAGVNLGRMPPGKIFIPRVVRARRGIVDLLKAMVLRHWATSVVEAA